jgi:hypothetical protein
MSFLKHTQTHTHTHTHTMTHKQTKNHNVFFVLKQSKIHSISFFSNKSARPRFVDPFELLGRKGAKWNGPPTPTTEGNDAI